MKKYILLLITIASLIILLFSINSRSSIDLKSHILSKHTKGKVLINVGASSTSSARLE